MTFVITEEEVNAAVGIVQSNAFGDTITAVRDAVTAKLGDIGQDAIAVEDVLQLLSGIPGLEALGDLSALIKIAMLVNSLSTPYPNGGIFGAFEDSVTGVARSVSNPSGAVG